MAEMREHNLAYDYNLYEEADHQEEKPVRKAPKPAVRHKHKTKSVVKFLLGTVAVFAMLCYMIYGRVELTGLYSQQSRLENDLSRLTSENVSLESELAQKTGLTKVETYAEDQLGLKKLDKSQIEFIEVPKREVAQAAPPADDNLFVKVKNWFSGMLEYIGAK